MIYVGWGELDISMQCIGQTTHHRYYFSNLPPLHGYRLIQLRTKTPLVPHVKWRRVVCVSEGNFPSGVQKKGVTRKELGFKSKLNSHMQSWCCCCFNLSAHYQIIVFPRVPLYDQTLATLKRRQLRVDRTESLICPLLFEV